jgi:hypothetical protein
MKKLTIAIAFVLHSVAGLLLLSIPSQAHAESGYFHDQRLTANDLRNFKPVNVILEDNAEGACWTNLKEVREYAEEKLRIKGIAVTDKMTVGLASDGYYNLILEVNARRLYKDGTGPCVGSYNLRMLGADYVGGFFSYVALGGASNRTAVQKDNFNRSTIEMVSQFFDKFPE